MSVKLIAQAAYPVILDWMRTHHKRQERITYGELSRLLPPPWTDVSPHTMLGGPLGLICERCRAVDLPVLSAIVVRDDAFAMPGPGYYPAAHGVVASDPRSGALWVAELPLVWAARKKYPPELP